MNGLSLTDVFSLGIIVGAFAVYVQFAFMAWRDRIKERGGTTSDS
jgi:hypothetical protein